MGLEVDKMLEKGNVYYEKLESFSQNLQSSLKEVFPEVHSEKSAQLKAQILKASGQYLFNENRSIWTEKWFKNAYLSYFIHTQTSRLFYAFTRTKDLIDFSKISKIVDFGAGPSSAHLAASKVFNKSINDIEWVNIDSAKEALEIGQKIEKHRSLKSTFKISAKIPEPQTDDEMIILSFAICEGLDTETLLKYKYIFILEPGQFEESKNLISFRESALKSSFEALAPCVHQKACPMREGRKNWCHDSAPKPSSLPNYDLPFSKKRLNFSYLLLKRSCEKDLQKTENLSQARVIGDLRLEKGKSKVAICSNESPSFLSWLKKSKLDMDLRRGDLIELPPEADHKGQEVRIETEVKILKD